MTKHTCNKEVELAEHGKDLKYIISLLEGNGKVGLISRVEANTKARFIFYGVTLTCTSALGVYFLSKLFI